MTLTDKVVQLRRHVIQRVALGVPVVRACREAGISRTLFYRWKREYLRYGDAGLWPALAVMASAEPSAPPQGGTHSHGR